VANADNKVGDNHFQFGAFAKNEVAEIKAQQDVRLEEVAYNNWREKIKISYQAPDVWDTDKPEAIGEHGTLVHNILKQVEVITDVDNALELALRKGLINNETLPEIKKEIDSVFEIEGVPYLFTDFEELKNERSILLKNKDGKVKEPDRVVVKDGKTYLIDYKTGEPKTEDEKQIIEYRNLLTQLGYENIVPYLLYLKSGELVGV
jgi:ATP-dependent exoDNAse (exonuclease V) beta subunit